MSEALNQDAASDLQALLDELCAEPQTPNVDWLRRLVARLRPAGAARAETGLVRFVALLEANPPYASAFATHVGGLLTGRMHRLAYAHSDQLGNRGFFSNLTGRLLGRLLPRNIGERFLSDLLEEVFDRSTDHEWLAAVPLQLWERLLVSIDVDGPHFDAVNRHCRYEMYQGLRLLATRTAALGTDPILIRYLPDLAHHESPFLAQLDEVTRLTAQPGGTDEPAPVDDGHLEVLLLQCDQYVAKIRRLSNEAGVDVGLVFQLARIDASLARLRLLRDMLLPATGDAQSRHGRLVAFFQRLVRQENRRNSISDLLSSTTELVARRVTERASRSGEHYVTETRAGLIDMYRAAAGAGLIIAVMALIKIFLGKLALPPLWEAMAFSLNYGLGFVLIHVLHLTIATKQPAMTAATLAASIDGMTNRQARIDALVELAAKVSRTQWVSIAGNVSVGFVTALAITITAGRFLDTYPIGAAKAAHLLDDLRPLHGPALLYAAIAGVYLFLSGLVSGYYDNLCLYHNVPERLRRTRWLRSLLGQARLQRLSNYVEHNLGALVGNFLFGCMLGSTPFVGKLIGLPLDIRHVAFASANLGYGLGTLDFSVDARTILGAIAGVLLIGLVNLIVSFQLALKTALRSRGIGPEQTDGLFFATLKRFWRRPSDFFWAESVAKTDPPPAA